MQKQIEDELEAKEHLQAHAAQQLKGKDKELRELRATLEKGDEEREELRARVTQVCATHLPELKQQLAEKDRLVEVLDEENEELRTRATQLVTDYLPVRISHRCLTDRTVASLVRLVLTVVHVVAGTQEQCQRARAREQRSAAAGG
jgi:chromosome segregation ATPase